MSRTTRMLIGTLGFVGALLVLGDAPARAADMCFRDDYNTTLVAKNFAFPGANTCKAVNAYELGTNCVVSGTACGTTFGEARFNLTVSCPFGYFGMSSFRIDKLYADLNQAGYGYACAPNTWNGSWTCTQWHINTGPCPSPRPLQ